MVSTLKLVDNLTEQALLEDILEASKPGLPAECEGLDYLLATPFRYGSVYPHGSRFRRAGRTRGVFYGAEKVETALAEIAFYRLLFFAESPGTPLPSNAADYTAFAASIATERAIDLTLAPLSEQEALFTDPLDYRACQDLADQARAADVQVIRYRSVRAATGDCNLAVLTCAAFAAKQPIDRQTWKIRITATGVQALCDFPKMSLEFPLSTFSFDPRIRSN